MRRFRSQAYRDFAAWIQKSRIPLQHAEDAHGKKHELWEHLMCSVVILTHSHFETYFRDIIYFLTVEVNSRKMSAEKLPGLLWPAMLNDSFPHREIKRYYLFENEREYLESLGKRLNSASPPDLQWHSKAHQGTITVGTIMGGESTYPTFERLSKVFHKLGKLHFRNEISRRIGTDPELILEEIGGLRGTVAHEGVPAGITASDVSQKIFRLCRVVKAIDELIVDELLGKALRP